MLIFPTIIYNMRTTTFKTKIAAVAMLLTGLTLSSSLLAQYLNSQCRVLKRSCFRFYIFGSLIGAVKSCHISPLFRMFDMEYNG